MGTPRQTPDEPLHPDRKLAREALHLIVEGKMLSHKEMDRAAKEAVANVLAVQKLSPRAREGVTCRKTSVTGEAIVTPTVFRQTTR